MAVPGERPDANAPGSTEASGASGAGSPRYASNTEILAWLDVLLKGKPEEQAKARTEIAIILEARGFAEDAEEAYWANVQARATDRRAYDRLIGLYQRRRDRLSETLVQRQLDAVFPAGGQPSALTGDAAGAGASASDDAEDGDAGDAGSGSSRVLGEGQPGVRRSIGAMGPEPAANLTLRAPNWPTLPPAGSTSASSGEHGEAGELDGDERPASTPPEPAAVSATAAERARAALQQRAGATGPAGQPGTQPVRAGDVLAGQRGMQPVRAGDVLAGRDAPAADVMAGAAMPGDVRPAGTDRRRRRTPLLPNPEPAASRLRFTTRGLIALEPMTIGAFLLASVGAAALIAFLLIAAERGRGTPVASPASGLPARCTDAALRFPGIGITDPRAAVVAAYRQQGVDVETPRPGNPRLSPEQAEQVVGGWMAISLLLEHGGQTPPSLVTWLDADTELPALANVIMAGRTLGSMITPEEWAEMRAWPAHSCEGAFLQEPRNAAHVQRMERVVGR